MSILKQAFEEFEEGVELRAAQPFASFDEAGSQWLTEAGTYTFRIGNSSRDIAATATLKLAEYTEKTTNALAPQQPLNLLKQ